MKSIYSLSLLTLILGGLFLADTPVALADDDHDDDEYERSYHYKWNTSPGNSAFGWSQGNGPKHKKEKFKNSNNYSNNYYDRDALLAYIDELRVLILRLSNNSGSYQNVAVDVITRSAININEDSAVLRGQVDFNQSDEATVYFQWGESRTNLNKKTSEVTLDDSDDEDFSRTVSGLDEDTLYYFRAVAEDEEGDKDYGSIFSFRTDEDTRNNEEPDVTTSSAQDIQDDSAELNGFADMNDFNNGRVFFIYGEERSDIEDAEDEQEYADINEDGDNLQKVTVDSDLDGSDNYALDVDRLDNDTQYYFRIAVEYEDEDGDLTIEFGNVRQFTTDN